MTNKIILLLAFNLSMCLAVVAQSGSESQKTASEKMNLKEQLDKKKAEFNAKAPEEKKRIYQEGINAIVATGILDKAIQVGDTAPNFTLKNALGNEVSLYSELKKGPVVLTWYRGGWCPYCNITLHELQQQLPNFKAAGANLLALTPEVPDQSMSTSEKHELEFEVLSDVGNGVGKQYGIVYTLTPEVAEIYQEAFGLHQYNGDESNELPLAATYVIDKDGVVRYAFLDAEYRNRAEPLEILEALKNIKQL